MPRPLAVRSAVPRPDDVRGVRPVRPVSVPPAAPAPVRPEAEVRPVAGLLSVTEPRRPRTRPGSSSAWAAPPATRRRLGRASSRWSGSVSRTVRPRGW
ncbi:hypothetical protein ACFQX7_05395 [Luedemannella flava]